MQSRRSLLVWKIFGERLDGFSNDDHPSEPKPARILPFTKASACRRTKPRPLRPRLPGTPMPPPDAVAGKYKTPDGRAIKVAPLTDEDRFTIVRWIDLGCPSISITTRSIPTNVTSAGCSTTIVPR
jgi:hypothetical protein